MTSLERSLRRAVDDLRSLEGEFALVGGLAVSARSEPRLTRDADFAVAVADDAEAETLIAALRARGYEVVATVEQEAADRLATVRLLRGDDDSDLVTDLLFASSGIESEIVAAADELLVTADLRVPVATVGHLLAMKLLARDDRRRPADADDLVALAEVADDVDWNEARSAAALIVERGFGRGRDLVSALDLLRSDGAY